MTDEEAVKQLSEWAASIAESSAICSIPEPSDVDCEMKVKQDAVVDSRLTEASTAE